jgi:peptidoglycan/LPS O-acetylase OafA/YrhL
LKSLPAALHDPFRQSSAALAVARCPRLGREIPSFPPFIIHNALSGDERRQRSPICAIAELRLVQLIMGWGKSHDFVLLDGLRGIAAIAVVTRHAIAFFPAEPAIGPIRSVLSGPFPESYLAVDFFFLLSGFVLAHAYGKQLKTNMSPAKFMVVRLIRLYPLYFLGLMASFGLMLYSAGHGAVTFKDNIVAASSEIFFIPVHGYPVHGLLFPLNAVSWSLFYELIVNLLFAISCFRINTAMFAGFVGACAIALITSVKFGWLGLGFGGPMDGGAWWGSEWGGLLRALTSFFGGVLLYEIRQRWRIPKIPLLMPALLLCIIFIANPTPRYSVMFDLTAVLVVFPIIVLFSASLKPRQWLANICLVLGTASYGVYVLQIPIADALEKVLYKLDPTQRFSPGIVSAAAFLAALLVIVLIVDRYYDVPLRHKLGLLIVPLDTKAAKTLTVTG